MINLLNKLKYVCLVMLMKLPILRRYKITFLNRLGAEIESDCFLASDIIFHGSYSNLRMESNSSITSGCIIIAKDKIIIGKNTGIAYGALILTSSNPRGPKNDLSKLYPKISKPVVIGDNCWIGARSVIFPGVVVGHHSVIAAGSIVNKNVPPYTVVGGTPIKTIKNISSYYEK